MKKKFYTPYEYINLLNYCLLTTNLGEKAESFLQSMYRQYVQKSNITARQYNALYKISIDCTEAHPRQTVLRKLAYED